MKEKESAYKRSGVDIGAAEKTVNLIKPHILSTYNERVITNFGLFAGLLDVSFLKRYKNPVLAFSIDGVGTEVMVGKMMNEWTTIGQDLVNHCVNDILTQGALPISFLDYIASDKLQQKAVEQIIFGMANACRKIGIERTKLPIMGGETAEMPGVYQKGQHDLVGCIIGAVEKENIINGSKIAEGDILIGLPSNGMHTNGYSLARKTLFETAGYNVNTYLDKLGCTIGEELLKIHKCYLKPISALLQSEIEIHGIAHITGGGFDNISRILPNKLCAKISKQWKIPPIFSIIQELENVSDAEMRRVFNLGIGMVIIIPIDDYATAKKILAENGELDNIAIGKIASYSCRNKKVFFTY